MASLGQDTEGPQISNTPFEYDASLEEYTVSEKDYLQQHPEYDVICTGICVFNKEGKLLLVQRAKTEKAYPDFWVLLTQAVAKAS